MNENSLGDTKSASAKCSLHAYAYDGTFFISSLEIHLLLTQPDFGNRCKDTIFFASALQPHSTELLLSRPTDILVIPSYLIGPQ